MKALRALVVDDNAVNSKLITHMLARMGWTTVVAGGGEQALALLAHESVDLMLLDLKMPHLGGEEVCRRIRNDLGLTSLPIVAYTAQSMPEEHARILEKGFDDLLIKPVTFAQVKAICDRHSERTAPAA